MHRARIRGGADAPAFDVASIRPHAPDDSRFGVKMPAKGRFSATGSVAKLLLVLAYDVQDSQITGGPDWLATEKWDVEARSDDRVEHTVEETRRMLQTLLEERFRLRIHRETEQRPAYVLTVTKNGPKFKTRDDGPTNFRITGNSINVERGDLARMTQILSTALGRPVIDRTGLNGLYDLSLQWDDAPIREGGLLGLEVPTAPGNDRGSIFTAIQDKLDATVVDAQHYHVELENEYVRVIRVSLGPHEKLRMHTHPVTGAVLVHLTDQNMRLTFADGTSRDSRYAARQVRWVEPGVAHQDENASDKPLTFIRVELKLAVK